MRLLVKELRIMWINLNTLLIWVQDWCTFQWCVSVTKFMTCTFWSYLGLLGELMVYFM
ncbi:hypothetical protein JHK82_034556 [Glycine max]|uniref:Uncharacterized protein n=2 Tax=Glycine subgen. Soja TaxID=1462606 RepID=K7LW64_SOYBN|nr:hypothetical protein JHK87_034502 [Glycine soja]KAG4981315.1 hypothetical protein JHK85_035273 [Glycine max]KAG4986936.1 hypothetical protein JHK86_034627 [Glycine max]KAG5120136.1 hypothetical protein JHK82_034556 [Glycine max]KAG5141121.1 hypothetical protein JHK84_034889 [Glycine max]